MTQVQKQQLLYRYPAIAKVCDLLDWELLTDLYESVEHPSLSWGVFALGQEQDHAAGFQRAVGTPWCRTVEELEDFCIRHWERFLTAGVQAAKTGEWVDAAEWDKIAPKPQKQGFWSQLFRRKA